MASLRLLRLLAVLVLAAVNAGCTLGPIWARRVEGQVIDKHTGAPVVDALLITVYDAFIALDGRAEMDTRWATTDAEGHFVIPGRLSLTFPHPMWFTDRNYAVYVFHPTYGSFLEMSGRRVESWPHHRFVFELEPDGSRLWFRDRSDYSNLCGGFGDEGFGRCCEYAYRLPTCGLNVELHR
jgi:hypothetical protein